VAVLEAERTGETVEKVRFTRAVRPDEQQRVLLNQRGEDDRFDVLHPHHAEAGENSRRCRGNWFYGFGFLAAHEILLVGVRMLLRGQIWEGSRELRCHSPHRSRFRADLGTLAARPGCRAVIGSEPSRHS
jgi:hypothetical protein